MKNIGLLNVRSFGLYVLKCGITNQLTAENSLIQQLKTKAINGLDIIKKEHIQQLYGCIPESTPFRTQYTDNTQFT